MSAVFDVDKFLAEFRGDISKLYDLRHALVLAHKQGLEGAGEVIRPPFHKHAHAVTAVWLCSEGNATVVRLEINGQWVEVIRDYAGFMSHIVESGGITRALNSGKLIPREK